MVNCIGYFARRNYLLLAFRSLNTWTLLPPWVHVCRVRIHVSIGTQRSFVRTNAWPWARFKRKGGSPACARARERAPNENASIRADFYEKDRRTGRRTNRFSIEPPVRDSCDPFFPESFSLPISFLFHLPLSLFQPLWNSRCFARLHNPSEREEPTRE